MAKKKKKTKTLSGLAGVKNAMKNMDIHGVAIVVLSSDGQIMIGSDGLDADTCQSLLSQSAEIMLEQSGISPTLH
jgi:hypothetical protein